MEKEYSYVVKIEFSGQTTATSKQQAKDIIKDDYKQEYGLDLDNKEITIE